VADLDELLAATLEQHRLGNLDEAERGYLAILAARPRQAKIYNLVGLVAHQRGQGGRAGEWVRRAISLAPAEPDAWKYRALFEGAGAMATISACRAAILAPADAERWLIVDAVSTGDRRALRRGLTLEPRSVDGWRKLAQRMLDTREADGALTAARRSASLSPAPARLSCHPFAPEPEPGSARLGSVRLAMSDGTVLITPYCIRLADAIVTGDFLVIQSTGAVLVGGLVPDPADPLRLTVGLDAIGPGHAILRHGRSKFASRAVLLGGSRNYYHWLIDHLPRLALLDAGDDRPLIVNDNPAPFQIEMLAHLGIARDRLIGLASSDWLHVRDLVAPSLLAQSSLPHPDALSWLRRRFLSTAKTGSRRIYVSRRKAAKRRLVDEDRLASALEKANFLVVEAEEMSVAQQIALFAGADIIVAPHGAALANLAFATPGSLVVEIDAEGSHRTFYPALAQLGGLSYERVNARPLNPLDLQDSDMRLGEHGLARLRHLFAGRPD